MNSDQSGTTEDHSAVDVNPMENLVDVDVAKGEENGTEITHSEQDMNPLEMPLMMVKILSFLDLDSIKKARQVNKFWSAEGAKILIKRCYVKSPWKILLQKPSRKNIKELRAFLAHTSRVELMVPNITIADPHDVELWMSFGVLGKQVTSLKLNIVGHESDWLKNILDLLANLKYLNIKNLKNKGEVITTIYTSVISTFEMDENRKPLIISPMILDFVKLEVAEKLSNCKSIMTDELNTSSWFRFGVSNIEARLANIINKLLSTNRNILKKLSMERCELFLCLLEFPCMTQLNQVKLCFRPDTAGHFSQCQFSPSFIFSEKIPNLEHVSLHCETTTFAPMNQNCLANLCASTGAAHSVKRLSYSGASSGFTIDPLFQVFPNVEDFQVIGTNCSQGLFETLWNHGKKLQKLHLYIKVHRSQDIIDMNARFSGFTPDTVNSILESQKSGFDTNLEEWEMLRVNPSILHLKELEHLVIHLSGPEIKRLSEDFLSVAGNFAFQRMPQEPKISIYVKGRKFKGVQKALGLGSSF